MRRRTFTLMGLAGSVLALMGVGAKAGPDPDDYKKREREDAEAARKYFPFELIEVRGDEALSKWQELKSAGRGVPVVLGGPDYSLRNLFEAFGPPLPNIPPPPTVEETLAMAAKINFPADLIVKRNKDNAEAEAWLQKSLKDDPNSQLPAIIVEDRDGKSRTLSREETLAQLQAPPREPPIGDWPATPDSSTGLSIAYDILKNTPLPKVYIALIPTDDWTTIPAYLRWGGWNECPAPEYHVAALRSWRDRYGIELVGLAFDTMNLTAARPPKTREEAIELAKEHYVYCADVIDQGVLTYSALAAALMANDWWFFWWD